MSEMVKRVAEAIEMCDPSAGATYEDAARAAIAAMREPTEEMEEQGRAQMPVEVAYWQENGALRAEMRPRRECVPPAKVWQAMIDAALVDNIPNPQHGA